MGGNREFGILPPPPSLSLPRKGGGDAAALTGLKLTSSGAGNSQRPSTFQVVTAGWPCGSGFIHQPRLSSSRPSGRSMRPSVSAGPPSTTAQ